MREINWQVMDKDKIIELILDHNASVDTLIPDMRRRIKGKLECMDAMTLWRHINDKYGGVLYGPDNAGLTDEQELKRRERLIEKMVITRKEVIKISIPQSVTNPFTEIDTACNEIWARSCVKEVYQCGNQLVVIMGDAAMTKKLRRWIDKKYPGLQVTIVGEGA
jgi:hypothetical protein